MHISIIIKIFNEDLYFVPDYYMYRIVIVLNNKV